MTEEEVNKKLDELNVRLDAIIAQVAALLDWAGAGDIAAIPYGAGSTVVGGVEPLVGGAQDGLAHGVNSKSSSLLPVASAFTRCSVLSIFRMRAMYIDRWRSRRRSLRCRRRRRGAPLASVCTSG